MSIELQRAKIAFEAFHTDVELAELGDWEDLPNEDKIRWQKVAFDLDPNVRNGQPRQHLKRIRDAYMNAESDAIQGELVRRYNEAGGEMTEEQFDTLETSLRSREQAKREQRGLLPGDLMNI